MTKEQTLRGLLRLSTVPRWCVIPTLNKQSAAEHTFNTLAIFDYLWHEFDLVFISDFEYGDVAYHLLHHDEDEAVSGDIPSNHKHKLSIVDEKHLSTKVLTVAKFCDLLEMVIFIETEKSMGNTLVANVGFELMYKLRNFVARANNKWGQEKSFQLFY